MKKGFGKGWIVIIYAFLVYFLSSAVSSSMNVAAGTLSELHGWSATLLTSFISLGSVANIIAGFIFGRMAVRKSAKKLSLVVIAIYTAFMFLLGATNQLWVFAVSLVLSNGLSSAVGFQLAPVIISKWFPKKKGVVMGLVTMGIPLCSGVASMIYSAGYSAFGSVGGFLPYIVLGVLTMIILGLGVSDNPREKGFAPDNRDITEAEKVMSDDKGEIFWTTKRLMSTPQVWIHGITLGVQLLFAGGIMVQLYPRLLEIGIDSGTAMMMMLASGLFALPGSYLCGVIDSKIGARKAVYTSYIFGITAMLLNLTGNIVCVWISLVCIGMVVGGAANWPASLCIEEFGDSFSSGYSVIQPMIQIVGAVGPVFFATIAGVTGNYVMSYVGGAIIMLVGMLAYALFAKKDFVKRAEQEASLGEIKYES